MRKLASIQRITKLTPILNADSIEVASVLGWKVVVKKGEFQEGDLCVYFEIDSLLPNIPLFEFMKAKHFRVRTIRLRGQISQGLCIPISVALDALFTHYKKIVTVEEGLDITEELHIEKYEPQIPACIAGEVKGYFPQNLVPKTDETRVQLLQDVIDKYNGTECYVTEKVDGSSATYYIKDGNFGVCSRNLDLKETPDNAFWQFAREAKIEEKLIKLKELTGHNYALQGELVGNGIQKNNLKILGRKVLFFNIFNIDTYTYVDFDLFKQYIDYLEIESVPIVTEKFILTNNIDELVKFSIAKSLINPNVYREGIIIRPVKEIVDLRMSQGLGSARLSFKVINPEYLLKYEE